MDLTVTILSSIGCFLTGIALYPQVIKILRTKSTKDVSWLLGIINIISGIIWILASALSIKNNNMAIPLIVVNSMTTLAGLIILSCKLYIEKIKK